MMSCSLVGPKESVARGLESLLRATAADEIIAAGQPFDQSARRESFKIKGGVVAFLGGKALLKRIVLLYGIAILSGIAIIFLWP